MEGNNASQQRYLTHTKDYYDAFAYVQCMFKINFFHHHTPFNIILIYNLN